ncbi:MAG TPA: hypothetical protein VNN08_09045 [Thermoanaerobaculia bacterium]|nr:hypothetical protein [Thermoanaerobaculia bacterium]
MTKPIIFVSCGQFNDDEKSLGKAVCQLINSETAYEPYFAEQQNTFDGLINNVFGALARASALVAIMHHRGDVNTPAGVVTRGSVWVEQEVAIGAFVHHVLKRPLEVALYLQRGISLEGARQQLLLGPTNFDTSSDVLGDLQHRLKSWRLTSAGRKSLIARWRSTRNRPPETDRHEHLFLVELVNNGLEKIDEWKAEIWFPSEYVQGADPHEEFVYQFDSDTNYSAEYRRIWPGNEPRQVFAINYFIDRNNWPNRPLWPGEERVERFVRLRVMGGEQPWEESIPMKLLQDF